MAGKWLRKLERGDATEAQEGRVSRTMVWSTLSATAEWSTEKNRVFMELGDMRVVGDTREMRNGSENQIL